MNEINRKITNEELEKIDYFCSRRPFSSGINIPDFVKPLRELECVDMLRATIKPGASGYAVGDVVRVVNPDIRDGYDIGDIGVVVGLVYGKTGNLFVTFSHGRKDTYVKAEEVEKLWHVDLEDTYIYDLRENHGLSGDDIKVIKTVVEALKCKTTKEVSKHD